jgi:hypothetical protein
MARSTGLPRGPGLAGITRVIRARVSSQTVTRVTESQGSLDESTETTSDHSEDIWLFRPNESIAEEVTGDRINGSLGGLVLADGSVDLQHRDRVSYGGAEYEVDTIVGHPEDGDPGNAPNTDFWIVSFDRRQ